MVIVNNQSGLSPRNAEPARCGPNYLQMSTSAGNSVRQEIDERVEPIRKCAYPGCQYPGALNKDRVFVEFNGFPYCEAHIGVVKAGDEFNKKCQCGGQP